MITPRRLFALSVCFALSGFGLIWFFKGTDWPQLWAALRGGNYLYIIPTLLLTLSTYCVRAYRWQILMNPIKRIRWVHLLSATTIGFMSNCVLPARVGELVRATAIGLKEQMSAATALTTVIVERIFDLFAVGVFVVIVLVLMPGDRASVTVAGPSASPEVRMTSAPGTSHAAHRAGARKFSLGDLRKWGVVVGAVTAGALVLMFLIKLYPTVALEAGQVPLRWLPRPLSERGTRILKGLIAGLQSLESASQLIYLAVLSVVHWALGVGSNIALGYCFNLHLGFAEASLIFVITALAVAVPQGPAFVGVFDAAAMVAMQIIGVSSIPAQSYVIVFHAVAVVPVTLMGFGFLWWEGLSFRQVTARREDPR